ncbi:hypothetical protein M5D96_003696, partial [Drosophila gunungcola]
EARLFLIVLALPLAGKLGEIEENWGVAAIVNGCFPRLRTGKFNFSLTNHLLWVGDFRGRQLRSRHCG